jgi:hypothetical protein
VLPEWHSCQWRELRSAGRAVCGAADCQAHARADDAKAYNGGANNGQTNDGKADNGKTHHSRTNNGTADDGCADHCCAHCGANCGAHRCADCGAAAGPILREWVPGGGECNVCTVMHFLTMCMLQLLCDCTHTQTRITCALIRQPVLHACLAHVLHREYWLQTRQ